MTDIFRSEGWYIHTVDVKTNTGAYDDFAKPVFETHTGVPCFYTRTDRLVVGADGKTMSVSGELYISLEYADWFKVNSVVTQANKPKALVLGVDVNAIGSEIDGAVVLLG